MRIAEYAYCGLTERRGAPLVLVLGGFFYSPKLVAESRADLSAFHLPKVDHIKALVPA